MNIGIKRHYQNLKKYLEKGKVLAIFGARRVGKTTLISDFLHQTKLDYKFVAGDHLKVQEILSSQDADELARFVEGYQLLVIDEAQDIPNIGMGLKILVDTHPKLRIIATGSSAFDLSRRIGEPLVGRKTTLKLFPVSQLELSKQLNRHELKEKLEESLIFGGYPEILTYKTYGKKMSTLNEMVGSYLLKDVLHLADIRQPQILMQLLKLLAFQIGSEVSLNELSMALKVDVKTVDRYLYFLQESFVIQSLTSLSRNLRKEITQKNKYYFLDLGIRNAVISNFNDLSTRNDAGQLWENFLFIERTKRNSYLPHYCNQYFWRTYDQKEVDYIEEWGGKLYGFEFKWSELKKTKPPKLFLETYPEADFKVITPENYLEFVLR